MKVLKFGETGRVGSGSVPSSPSSLFVRGLPSLIDRGEGEDKGGLVRVTERV